MSICMDSPEDVRLLSRPASADRAAGEPAVAAAPGHPTVEAACSRALELVADGVLVVGANGRILTANRALAAMTGYTAVELQGQCCSILGGAETSPQTRGQWAQALRDGECFSGELRMYRKDGSSFWCELVVDPVHDHGGRLSHFVHIQRDLSARDEERMQRRLAAQVFAQSREAILVTDASGNIVMANPAFTAISGYTLEDVLGHNPRLHAASSQAQNFYLGVRDAVARHGIWKGEIRSPRKNGTDYPEALTVSGVCDALGQVCHYIGTFSDLSEQQVARERIDHLSNFDGLTGLTNRNMLAQRCARDIAAAQAAGEPMAMVLLGLDQFKHVNDTHGRFLGDQVLRQLAQRLVDCASACDTVARVSGDEFALLVPGLGAARVADLTARWSAAITQPIAIDGVDIAVTACMGVAVFPGDGRDFETLFKSAEVAMRQAKHEGRALCRFFEPEMLESAVAGAALESALRLAIALDQLQLHYQPFADLQTGQVGGMEALLRWTHPELGVVSPARFIPIAERSGLIVEIGAWVFQRACRDMREWLDRGLRVPPVSVNISPAQFRDPGLLRQIEATLGQYALTPDRVCIEVTEGALMEDVAHTAEVLRALKNLGVKLSLDDFGTGYSSLSYLKNFPFDKVKIDQSFVRGVHNNPQDAVIVKVVIAMAHGLGLHVIAEGVETEAQCEFMRANLCDEIQGYFFSRPSPRQQVEAFLRTQPRLPAHLCREQARQRCLLLVDNDSGTVRALSTLLGQDGTRVLTAPDGPSGLQVLATHPVDLVLLDYRRSGATGIEFLRQVMQQRPDTIRIVLSSPDEIQTAIHAMNDGTVDRFLIKPVGEHQMRDSVADAFLHKELADENRQLNLKIRSANHELASSNRQLQEVLGRQQRLIDDTELNLSVVRDALECIPMPVLGLDDRGTVAFANAEAQSLLGANTDLLGCDSVVALPELAAAVRVLYEGQSGRVTLEGADYRIQWRHMGQQSVSSGKLLTLRLDEQAVLP